MNCAKFRAGLQEAIEQRQPIPADVRQHGESCPIEECQQEWGDFLLVERALAQWLLAAPVDLA
ncbi:MAG: hypothetical protein KDA80_23015, partial [Planctomycetaceae bacterium]|nr:hypothetical protein [Planctomycetaceae bacterium]